MFSENEAKILKILGRRKMTIDQVTKKVYLKKSSKPLYPNNVVSNAVLKINRKCKYHNLNWHLSSSGTGRAGKTIWREKQ